VLPSIEWRQNVGFRHSIRFATPESEPVTPFTPATKAAECLIDGRRARDRVGRRGRSGVGHWRAPSSARIATLRRVAPARCGAFGDEQRIVPGDIARS
jgi:hypothetical protein